MTGRLDGKTALITGGTSGIGAATAELFVREGAKVVVQEGQKIKAAAGSLGSSATFYEADITNEAEIAASIDFTVQTLGKLDILFNNAGGPVGAPLGSCLKTISIMGSNCCFQASF